VVSHLVPRSAGLPRLVVAASGTGQGKTTVATGLMAALRRAGHEVSGHKVGPDYIDPGYHALACGRPGRNLDPHLVGEERIVPLLLHGAAGADVAVVEGVMGLYDGRVGHDGFASTAHLARLTSTPVVLVADISRASRTIGAVVHGLATFEPGVHVAGVVLNRAGTPRHAREVESSLRLPVLGVIPRDDRLQAPSRHLGLVPAGERDAALTIVDRWADVVTEHVDLDAVLRIASTAPDLAGPAWDPGREVTAAGTGRPVVAMAGGRAFTFRYAETAELLEAAGCAVAELDPLEHTSLPPGTAGLYLGGGFPEMHVAALAGNEALLEEVHRAVADGLPTVAECAGLLYLSRTLDAGSRGPRPMTGSLPTDARMTSHLTLRYPEATAVADTLLTRVGEAVTGHEFHHTTVEPAAALATRGQAAWCVDGEYVGFASESLHASYLHIHWAGHPQLAQRFADAVHRQGHAHG
jgi:cobyrinic acid a,c-diamide synthase